MTFHKHKDDEFDKLIEHALKSEIAWREPPRGVWRKILKILKQGQKTSHVFVSRWAVAVQIGLVLLVVTANPSLISIPQPAPVADTLAAFPTPNASSEIVFRSFRPLNSGTVATIITLENKEMSQLKAQNFARNSNPVSKPLILPPNDVLRTDGFRFPLEHQLAQLTIDLSPQILFGGDLP